MFVCYACVCVRVRVRVHVCVHVCMRVCMCVFVCKRERYSVARQALAIRVLMQYFMRAGMRMSNKMIIVLNAISTLLIIISYINTACC